MPKNNRRSQKNTKKSVRVVTNNTRRISRLQPIQDNRLFQPLTIVERPVMTIYSKPAKVYNNPNIRKRGSSLFTNIPKSALICARRKIRKEVIFAKNKNGSGNKKPRHNENSKLYCKG